jgi:hypothetical protein
MNVAKIIHYVKLCLETLTNLPFLPRCKDTIMFDHRPGTLVQEFSIWRRQPEVTTSNGRNENS